MKSRTFLPVVAVLFAAFTLPTHTFAQTFLKNKNQSRKLRSVIAGGSGNFVPFQTATAFIGGGASNACGQNGGSTRSMVVGGGEGNTARSDYTFVGGGIFNVADDSRAIVVGGERNRAGGTFAIVGGGYANTNGGYMATAGGGYNNTVSGNYAIVGGGFQNEASGDSSCVPGGRQNAATNAYSLAAGRRAKTTAVGQFVWADSQDGDYEPSWFLPADTFNVRARGGVRFTSDLGGANQTVSWAPGGGSWSFTSDVSSKEDFRRIDSRDILRRVASMPVAEWNYIGYTQRHIGPTAQDWHAAFPLGEDDKTINTADMHGVSLAAIKGLVEELRDRDKAMAERDAAIDELKAKLQAVEQRLNSLPPAP